MPVMPVGAATASCGNSARASSGRRGWGVRGSAFARSATAHRARGRRMAVVSDDAEDFKPDAVNLVCSSKGRALASRPQFGFPSGEPARCPGPPFRQGWPTRCLCRRADGAVNSSRSEAAGRRIELFRRCWIRAGCRPVVGRFRRWLSCTRRSASTCSGRLGVGGAISQTCRSDEVGPSEGRSRRRTVRWISVGSVLGELTSRHVSCSAETAPVATPGTGTRRRGRRGRR